LSSSITGRGLYHDPLYGHIPLNPLIEQALDLVPVQRLRRVKQLGLLHLRYPGATHTRFAHSVGVYHLATRSIDELIRKRYTPKYSHWPRITVAHKLAVQLAALFHDVGHGPMSHLWESFCRSRSLDEYNEWKHDRISYRLISEGLEFGIKKEENMKRPDNDSLKVQGRDSEGAEDPKNDEAKVELDHIPKFIDYAKQTIKKRTDCTPEDLEILKPASIANIAVGLPPLVGKDYLFLSNLIVSPFDCDRLDYFRRDSMFTGVETGRIDIWEIVSSLIIGTPKEGGRSLMVQKPAAPAVETLLTIRDLIYRKVYYDSIHRGNEELMIRAMNELVESYSMSELWLCTDEELLALLQRSKPLDRVADRIFFRQPYKPLPLIINESQHLDGQSKKRISVLRTTERSKITEAETRAEKHFPDSTYRALFSLSRVKFTSPKDYQAESIWNENLNKSETLLEALPHLKIIWDSESGEDPLIEELEANLSEYFIYVPPEALEASIIEARRFLDSIGATHEWGRNEVQQALTKAINDDKLDWITIFASILEEFNQLIQVGETKKAVIMTEFENNMAGFLANHFPSPSYS